MKRTTSVLPAPHLTKSSIHPSLHNLVDATLKRLKSNARRLTSSMIAFEEEYRILDRLFYKGKNQHRTSLFWRHVEEMRKLCGRLHKLNLAGTATQLRHVFYNSTDYHDSNILKSSWTHVPDSKGLTKTISYFNASCQLLRKSSERYLNAYCVLKRAIQTGAFLQLILTLCAVACRLRALSEHLIEIQEDIVATLTECREFLGSIPAHDQSNSNVMPPLLTNSQAVTTISSPNKPSTTRALSFPEPDGTSGPSGTMDNTSDDQLKHNIDLHLPFGQQTATDVSLSLQPCQTLDKSTKSDPRRKKKKKAANEIDTIFGF